MCNGIDDVISIGPHWAFSFLDNVDDVIVRIERCELFVVLSRNKGQGFSLVAVFKINALDDGPIGIIGHLPVMEILQGFFAATLINLKCHAVTGAARNQPDNQPRSLWCSSIVYGPQTQSTAEPV